MLDLIGRSPREAPESHGKRPRSEPSRKADATRLSPVLPFSSAWSAPASRRRGPRACTSGKAPSRACATIYKLIDLETLGLDAERLPDILTAAQRFGFAGLNITHPCKQAVIPLLDELSPDAEALGAVNTVVLKDGRRVGHNTDWWGFAESFRRELSGRPPRPRRAVRRRRRGCRGGPCAADPGSGRSHDRRHGRSAGPQSRGGPVRAVRQRAARRQALACRRRWPPPTAWSTRRRSAWRTIPAWPFRRDLLRPDLWVADIVYFPLETELLREARARGCRTMSGGGMAVFQAVGAFRLFTGRSRMPQRMLRHFDEM